MLRPCIYWFWYTNKKPPPSLTHKQTNRKIDKRIHHQARGKTHLKKRTNDFSSPPPLSARMVTSCSPMLFSFSECLLCLLLCLLLDFAFALMFAILSILSSLANLSLLLGSPISSLFFLLFRSWFFFLMPLYMSSNSADVELVRIWISMFPFPSAENIPNEVNEVLLSLSFKTWTLEARFDQKLATALALWTAGASAVTWKATRATNPSHVTPILLRRNFIRSSDLQL